MVIALFALALAMIVGGLFTFLLGWEDVLLERGWTTAVAGSVSAASGVLLLGLTAIVWRLSGIRKDIAALRETLAMARRVTQSSLGETQPSIAPGLATGTAAVAAGVAAAGLADTSGDQRPIDFLQPDLPLFGTADEDASSRETTEELRDEPREAPPISLDDFEDEFAREEGFAREEPRDREEAPDVRIPDFLIERRETFSAAYTEEGSDLGALAARERELAEPMLPEEDPETDYRIEPLNEGADESVEETIEAIEPEPAPQPPSVIGTYNSGDNTYVMFSDGSIEAKTPQGEFRFGSLDELKAFIASGGEDNASI